MNWKVFKTDEHKFEVVVEEFLCAIQKPKKMLPDCVFLTIKQVRVSILVWARFQFAKTGDPQNNEGTIRKEV